MPLLEGMTGPARVERIKRYARYMSHLLGGAHHPHLVGNLEEDLEDALENVGRMQHNPPAVFNMQNINNALQNYNRVDIEPWSEDEE